MQQSSDVATPATGHGASGSDEPPATAELPAAMALLLRAALSAVLGYSLVAMPLAMLGVLRPFVTAVLATTLAVLVFIVWNRSLRPPAPTRRGREAVAAAVAAVLLILGITALNARFASEHLYVDRDPGVYLVTGEWLADEGHLRVDGLVGAFADDTDLRVAGMGFYPSDDPSWLYPQFFHLLPVLLAAGSWVGGAWLLVKVNALIGGLALLAFYAFSTRLVRPWLAFVATAALAVNLVQVHFTRDAYTEVLSQALLFGGLWALSLARERGGGWSGVVAGAIVGATSMTRVDALFYLVPLVAFCAYELVAARLGEAGDRGRRVRVVAGVGVGVAVTAALGLADGWFFARPYVVDLGGELRLILLALAGATAVGAVAVAAAGPIGGLLRRAARHRDAIAAAAAAAVVAGGLFAWVVWPAIDTVVDPGQAQGTGWEGLVAGLQAREGQPVDGTRTYAEETFRRLALYVGPVGVAAGIAGVAIAVARVLRGREDRAVAFLAVFLATTSLYTWRPSITPDMLWAMRRYLPVVIPGLVLWASYACHLLLSVRGRRWRTHPARVLATAIAALLVGFPLWAFAPLYDTRTRAAPLPSTQILCDELPPDAVALLLGEERVSQVLPQTLQSLCDVPVAVLPAGEGLPRVSQLDSEWEAADRDLYVLSEQDRLFGALDPAAAVTIPSSFLERTVQKRPTEDVVETKTVHVFPLE